ncbi:BatD family protein [Limibacter armeniacum]|uniref:BatD family protein n=1 Tax=Limibacter armeniacum TaxID=466084 RepID=UPI002FE5BA34
MVRFLIILVMVLASWSQVKAQAFATAYAYPKSVYQQQPFRVKVTVYTATWFTAPLEFENLQIPNAFILPFERTVSGMHNINGKQYAGLEFFYIVFPYEPGDYQVPPISIKAETPPEGSSTSRTVTVKTKPISFKVKEVPKDLKKENWMVANNVFISEKWNKPLDNLKVGDVLERAITISGRGTLPAFIPEVAMQKVDWASIYPKSPQLLDRRDDQNANGIRIETASYLLEKEGTFELPPEKVSWWNPYTKKISSKQTPPREVKVAANPNLGVLATMQDSLSNATDDSEEMKQGKTILGLPWWEVALLLLFGLLLLYYFFRLLKAIYTVFKVGKAEYRQSEAFYFDRLQYVKHKTADAFFKDFYQWWDRFRLENKKASFRHTPVIKSEEVQTYWERNEKIFANDSKGPIGDQEGFMREIKTLRTLGMNKSSKSSLLNHQQEWRIKNKGEE